MNDLDALVSAVVAAIQQKPDLFANADQVDIFANAHVPVEQECNCEVTFSVSDVINEIYDVADKVDSLGEYALASILNNVASILSGE